MADITRTIEIIFGAVDNTGSTLTGIADNTNSFVAGMSSIASPLADVAEFAEKAEVAIAALAAAYGTYAVVKASEFQTAQIDLAKVLDETDPKIGSFTDRVIQLSERYGESSAIILQGIANFRQAGFTAKEAADLQVNALDLVIAGDIEASAASELLVASLKGFNATAAEAPRFIEAMNNVSNDYATDLEQLAIGISKVSPAMHTMGFTFEESTGFLTPLIEVYRSGAIAADALKVGLIRLTDDSKSVREGLTSIGVAQFDLNGNMRSGRDIAYDVGNAFKDLDQNQKIVIASQLFGIEQGAKLVTVFDNMAKVVDVTASAMERSGSVQKEVELRLASLAKQADILKASFDNVAIVIGTKIGTEFVGLATGATSVLQAFRKIVESGGLDDFFEALHPVMVNFEEQLKQIAVNLPAAFEQVDFTKLIQSMQDLGFEFGALFDGIDTSTPEGLAQAIQIAVNGLAGLTEFVAGIVQSWNPIVDQIKQAVEWFGNLTAEQQRSMGATSGYGQIFETFKGTLEGGIDILKNIGLALTAIAGINVGSGLLSIGSSIAGMSASSVALLGPLGAVVASLAAIGIGTYSVISAYDEYQQRGKDIADTELNTAQQREANADSLKKISESTGYVIESMAQLNSMQDAGIIKLNESTGAWESTTEVVRDYDAEVAAVAAGGQSFADMVNKVASGIVGIGDAAKPANEELGKLAEMSNDVNKSFTDLETAQKFLKESMTSGHTGLITYADGHYQVTIRQKELSETSKELTTTTKNAGKATEDAAKAGAIGSKEWKVVQDVLLDVQKEADNFEIAMTKLSNEKYEVEVRAMVDLKVAEIEGDTQRIAAAYESITEVVKALAPEVTNLWGAFSASSSSWDKSEIAAAAKRMEARVDAELQSQLNLNQAQIDKMNAQTARLTSGQPLISIDAGSLAPELEMVFDKILKYTQVKATEQGLSLLMGI